MAGQLVLHRYYTSVDRAGWAVAVGGLIAGTLATMLLALGGQTSVLALLATLVVGSLLSAMAITAVGVPVWIVMHVSGRRGPAYAALVGAIIGFVLFVAGQTQGFGLADAAPSDLATQLMRWASAAATSLVLAVITALIGVAMWRVAYRRAG